MVRLRQKRSINDILTVRCKVDNSSAGSSNLLLHLLHPLKTKATSSQWSWQFLQQDVCMCSCKRNHICRMSRIGSCCICNLKQNTVLSRKKDNGKGFVRVSHFISPTHKRGVKMSISPQTSVCLWHRNCQTDGPICCGGREFDGGYSQPYLKSIRL